MPRLPKFEPKVSPTSGMAQQGNIHLPNVNVPSPVLMPIEKETTDDSLASAAKMFSNLQTQSKEVGHAFASLAAKRAHDQLVIEQMRAVTAGYREDAAIYSQHVNDNSPELPQVLDKKYTESRNKILEGVSPQNQPRIAAVLDQQFSQSYRSAVKEYADRVQTATNREFLSGAEKLTDLAANAWVKGDLDKYKEIMGHVHGAAEAVQGKMPGGVKESGGPQLWAEQKVGERIRGLLLADNPSRVLAMIETTEGLRQLGATGAQKDDLKRQAVAAIHNERTVVYDAVLEGFAKDRIPTPDQISRLSGGQQLHVKNLIESRTNEDNKQAVVGFYNRIVQLKPGSPAIQEDGAKVYNEVIASKLLSVGTKLNFMKDVAHRMDDKQPNQAKLIQDTAKSFGSTMTKDQHRLFMGNYFYIDPKGARSLPANTPLKEQLEHMKEYTINYIRDSQEEIANKGKKDDLVGRMQEAIDASPTQGGRGAKSLVGKKTQSFIAPGNYKLDNGKIVTINSQAEFNKIMGR